MSKPSSSCILIASEAQKKSSLPFDNVEIVGASAANEAKVGM